MKAVRASFIAPPAAAIASSSCYRVRERDLTSSGTGTETGCAASTDEWVIVFMKFRNQIQPSLYIHRMPARQDGQELEARRSEFEARSAFKEDLRRPTARKESLSYVAGSILSVEAFECTLTLGGCLISGGRITQNGQMGNRTRPGNLFQLSYRW